MPREALNNASLGISSKEFFDIINLILSYLEIIVKTELKLSFFLCHEELLFIKSILLDHCECKILQLNYCSKHSTKC